MSILLKVLIIYIFLCIFLFGIIMSKIKINLKELNINNDNQKLSLKYSINLGLYLYGILKIFSLWIDENGIKIYGIKISYKKIFESNIYKRLKNADIKKIEHNLKFSDFKDLKIKLEKLDFNLKIGFESVLLTSFSVFVISTIMSAIVKLTVDEYNDIKYKFKIMPEFNTSNIDLKSNCIICIKFTHIIFIFLNYKRREGNKNERTSYRRSYENGYE